MTSKEDFYEFAVIGAGVVGCAIARELTQYTRSVVLIDALDDVGADTSKANTAILHTGFDMKPGTLESKLVSEGYKLLLDFANRNQISVESTGAILVAWNQNELDEIKNIQFRAIENGYLRTRILTRDEINELEPNLGSEVKGGLLVPDEFIIDPWSVSIAYATQAKTAGATLKLNNKITQIDFENETFVLTGTKDIIKSKFIINSAGLYSDDIDKLLGFEDLLITPRRGELIVFDKLARKLVNHIILPVPTKMGKGVLISPTIFGNLMLGPTAVDVKDKSDKSTTEDGLTYLLEKGKVLAPKLLDEEITTMYTGLRAASNFSDYVITKRESIPYMTIGGIRSTGLTASLSIARYVADILKNDNFLKNKIQNHSDLKMPILGESSNRPYQDDEKINSHPNYGEIVCHCEKVTKGEILDALRSEIPATSISTLSRRTRVCLGRCQGFYCISNIRKIMQNEGLATSSGLIESK